MGSLIVASIRTGSLALGDVAVQALLGAFAARQGVLSQEALGKISLLFVRVLMPCLAISFATSYTADRIGRFWAVPFLAALHLVIGMVLGRVVAALLRLPPSLSPVLPLAAGVSNCAALPLALVPPIVANWPLVNRDAEAASKAQAAIGLYLCGFFIVSYSLVKGYIATLASGGPPPPSTTDTNVASHGAASRAYSMLCRVLSGTDPVIYCSLLALVIGAIAPLRRLFATDPRPGELSWAMTAASAVGRLVPSLSLLILGGVLYNTQRASTMQPPNEKEPEKGAAAPAPDRTPSCGGDVDIEASAAVVRIQQMAVATLHDLKPPRLARIATPVEIFQAAYGDGCASPHGTHDDSAGDAVIGAAVPSRPPPDADAPPPAHIARRTTIMAMLCKLVLVPTICIPLNFLMRTVHVLPDEPIVIMTLNLSCSMPTAATVIAMLMAEGCEAAAGATSASMLPMYVLSLITMLGVIVLSTALLDKSAADTVADSNPAISANCSDYYNNFTS